MDFHSSLGEEIAISLSRFVDSELLSAHEAMQPIYNLFEDTEVTIEMLSRLSCQMLTQLTQEFNDWFEVQSMTEADVADVLSAALARWNDVELIIDD